jgi:hypothetical protein
VLGPNCGPQRRQDAARRVRPRLQLVTPSTPKGPARPRRPPARSRNSSAPRRGSERAGLGQQRLELAAGGLGGRVVAAADELAADKHARHAGGGAAGRGARRGGREARLAGGTARGGRRGRGARRRDVLKKQKSARLRPPVSSSSASWIESPSGRLSSCAPRRAAGAREGGAWVGTIHGERAVRASGWPRAQRPCATTPRLRSPPRP